MENGTSFMCFSPRHVRRQLSFNRTEEIQRTPKCKLTKSKVLGKISKNKVIIDFNVEQNYFLENLDSDHCDSMIDDYSTQCSDAHYQAMLYGASASQWSYASPMRTARKPRNTSTHSNEFPSMIKQAKTAKACEESPFCRLLNDSDNFSVDKYQNLTVGHGLDEDNDTLRSKFEDQVHVLEKFFFYFQHRNANIMDVFAQGSIFEVLGESAVHDVNTTLNALARIFSSFEQEVGYVGFNYKFSASEEENEIIVSTTGRMASRGFKPEFVLSAKVLLRECQIKHLKLKIC